MAIDERTEDLLSNARSRKRQDKRVPLLIRDDGMLYPNVPLVAKKQNFRPYHGDPRASLQDRLRYLQGFTQRRKVVFEPEPETAFELSKASAEEVIAFAAEEYGASLDPSLPIDSLRAECFRLSQLPDMELPMAAPRVETRDQGVPTIGAIGIGAAGSVTAKPPTRRSSRGTAEA